MTNTNLAVISVDEEQNNDVFAVDFSVGDTGFAAYDIEIAAERASLMKALGHLQSVVEKKTSLPILSNVKLEAEGDTLKLTTTDTDIEISETIKVKVKKPGATTVHAQTFYEIVRKLTDGAEVQLNGSKVAGGRLEIRSAASDFNLATLPADEFPSLDRGEVSQKFSLLPVEVVALIDRTKFAMSLEETRYYLNGIFLHTKPDPEASTLKLCAAATDGHRLAKVEMPAPEDMQELAGIIIPRKTINEIRKLVDDSINLVEFEVSENKISVICGETILISKLIDGTFPDYQRVIPTGNNFVAEVNSEILASAVDRVCTVSFEKTRAVQLDFSHNHLRVLANRDESDNGLEEMEIKYDNEPFTLVFNSRYLLEVMSVIKSDKVQITFKKEGGQVLVVDNSDYNSMFVIMPLKV